MKRLYLIIIIFITTSLKAQSIYVEYIVNSIDVVSKQRLIANRTNFVYSTVAQEIVNNDTLTQIGVDSYVIKPKNVKIPEMQYYGTINSSSMHIVNLNPNNKPIVALDSLPKLVWNIQTNDKKTILGMECFKATTVFRGSNIVAYFTNEIPIPFGPFKFKDLPGLILEIYNTDSNYNYKWEAIEIKYPFDVDDKKLIFEENYSDVDIESLEYLIKKFQRRLNAMDNRSTSSMPRGSTVQSKTTRMGIEQIYEWER